MDLVWIVPGLIMIGLILNYYLKSKRQDVWQEVAKAYGLHINSSHTGEMLIKGNIGDREVKISTEEHGSDTEAGIAVVNVSVKLAGVPNEMIVEGIPGFLGNLVSIGQERIETGDEEFDKDVLIKSADPDFAKRYWNSQRKAEFLNLIQNNNFDQIILKEKFIIGQIRSILSRQEQLIERLQLLLESAAILDFASKDGE